MPETIGVGQTILILSCSVVAVFTDVAYQKIYNWLTLPVAIAGLAFNFAFLGLPGLISAIKGLGVGFSFLFIFYLLGGIGGGDVKLLAAIGAVGGYPYIFQVIVLMALVGGLLAIALSLTNQSLRIAFKRLFQLLLQLVTPGLVVESKEFGGVDKKNLKVIPYGVAIGLGSILGLFVRVF
jgi:prepilin peptidase CpaA